jgi:CspA family cold shock protein
LASKALQFCTGFQKSAWITHFLLSGRTRDVIFDRGDSSKRPQEAPKIAAAYGVMASGLGHKGSDAQVASELDTAGDIVDQSAVSIIELTGAIKWFDVAKGFGFIVPDNGLPDVLLHVTCLRRDGFQAAYEGARVVCEVLQRPKGLQVFRILSMDESTAVHPAQLPPARTHVSISPTSGLERAQVKWFNRLRGFGFLTCGEGTPDIFIHMETLRRYGIAELRPGQTVLVRFGPGPKGMMAAEVHPDSGPRGPASH